ncbi:hypothetical protein [Candidatus Nitrososphaera sp. FF02]|uniref:hypothetical protein n=1 Tax=Candidatus Nitrososphaera sp. FF02 TaxID=3398226 RepID=UPI0039ED403F
MKPFEISILPEHKACFLSPDISVFEIASNDSLLYGKDIRNQLPKNIPKISAHKIILNRLLGLNLCLRDLFTRNLQESLTRTMINYESAKGILAALEAILVVEGEYKVSYKERIAYWTTLIAKRPSLKNELPNIDSSIAQAALIRSNPETDTIDPWSFWYQSRTVLLATLAYLEKYYTLTDYNAAFPDLPLLKHIAYLFLNNRLDQQSIEQLQLKRANYYSLMLEAIRIPRDDLTIDTLLLDKLRSITHWGTDNSGNDLSQYLNITSKINFGCTNAELRWLTDRAQIIK